MMTRRTLLAVPLAVACLVSSLCAADNWPRFRGPSGQGVADTKSLPLTWSETQNITWKIPIHGRAWSSPVIWGEQVWLTTASEDGRELSVICVGKADGKTIFDKKVFDVATPQYAHPFNSYGSPTPTIEEGRIYVTFGSPGTACLDTKTGNVLWERRDFVCNHFRGAGSSPLLFDGLLIMNFDGSDHQFIVALDKNTGKTVWQKDRSIDYEDLQPDGTPKAQGDWRKAFSTPVIADVGGRKMVVSLASKAVYFYDTHTGQEFLRVENRKSHSGSATPVVGDGLVYIETGFDQATLLAIRTDLAGDPPKDPVAWRVTRHVPNKPSPLLIDGRLYMITDGGIASCVDAKTGDDIFHGRIDGAFSASPIYAAGRIYIFDEAGKTTVIEPGRELKVLAENVLADGIMASPAVSGDSLFMRTRTHLYRIDAAGASAGATAR